jgi:hypothetical protein
MQSKLPRSKSAKRATPMRETDPRHMPPNYYFDQIDWLTAYQRGKEWDWVELRPQTLCGFSRGSPMRREA